MHFVISSTSYPAEPSRCAGDSPVFRKKTGSRSPFLPLRYHVLPAFPRVEAQIGPKWNPVSVGHCRGQPASAGTLGNILHCRGQLASAGTLGNILKISAGKGPLRGWSFSRGSNFPPGRVPCGRSGDQPALGADGSCCTVTPAQRETALKPMCSPVQDGRWIFAPL